jgi:hypothetical protein
MSRDGSLSFTSQCLKIQKIDCLSELHQKILVGTGRRNELMRAGQIEPLGSCNAAGCVLSFGR